MQNLTLSDGVSALVLTADSESKLEVVRGSGNGAGQTARLEFDQEAISVSLLNSSDLGLTVDNSGLTTVFSLKTPVLYMPSPNGTLFKITPDDNGNLLSVAV
jgi:hypothetical protein